MEAESGRAWVRVSNPKEPKTAAARHGSRTGRFVLAQLSFVRTELSFLFRTCGSEPILQSNLVRGVGHELGK